MIDPEKILKELTKGGLGGGLGGGLLGGALGGKKRKGGSGKLLQLGTLAAVGAVAYKAWQAHQQGQATKAGGAAPDPFGLPPGAGAGVGAGAGAGAAGGGAFGGAWAPPAPPSTLDATTLLRAMIAAAKADGQVDAAESQRILGQLGRANLSAEERSFLLDELAKPLNVDAVVAGVRTPQQAAEVYTASRLVIAEASPAEEAYLGLLAARLNLDAQATRELDRAVGALPG